MEEMISKTNGIQDINNYNVNAVAQLHIESNKHWEVFGH
jgi:hypothetical protein